MHIVFDWRPVDGFSPVYNAGGVLVASVRQDWTKTSFTVRSAAGDVLCVVDRGGLVLTHWTAITAGGTPLLVFTSASRGGLISFADGRTARLKRQFASESWSVYNETDKSVLVDAGSSQQRSLPHGGCLGVQSLDDGLSPAELVSIVWSYRLDRRRRSRLTRLRWLVPFRPH